MASFLARRLAYMVVTLVAISMLAFLMIDFAPGSALSAEITRLQASGTDVSQDQIHTLEQQYGLTDPIYARYWKWVSGFTHGDFGQSFTHRAPVGELIWGRLGYSALLAGAAIILAWMIAIPIGVYSATHRYSIPDHLITLVQFIGVAIPEFLLALLVLVFASRFLGVDVSGLFSVEYQDAPWSMAKLMDLLKHVWVPMVVISAGSTAVLTRVMRANLLDVLNQQYVQTARAKGLSERKVVWKHATRNAIHPLIMSIGGLLPAFISGETIVSIVLNLPTTGPLLFDALVDKDMYLAITILMLLSMLLVIGNLIADIVLNVVDPRAGSTE